jgi:hypothetical protein
MEGASGRMLKFLLIIFFIIGFAWVYAVQLVNPESDISRFIQENFLGKEQKPLPENDSDSLKKVIDTSEQKKSYSYTPSKEYQNYFARRQDRPLPRSVKTTPPTPVKRKNLAVNKQPVTAPKKMTQLPITDSAAAPQKTNLPDKPGTISIRQGQRFQDSIFTAGMVGQNIFGFSLLANNKSALVSEIYLENDLNNDERVDRTQFEDSYDFALYTSSGNFLADGQMPGDGTIFFALAQPLRISAESQADLVVKVDVLPFDSLNQRLKEVRLSIDKNAAQNGIAAREEGTQKSIISVVGDSFGARIINTKTQFRLRDLGLVGADKQAVVRFSLTGEEASSYIRRVSFGLSSASTSFDGENFPATRSLALHNASSGGKSLAKIDRVRAGQYAVNFIQPVLELKPHETKIFEIRYAGYLSQQESIKSSVLWDTKLFTKTMARDLANIVWSDIRSSSDYYLSGYFLQK